MNNKENNLLSIGYWLSPKNLLNHVAIINADAKEDGKQYSAALLEIRAWQIIALACCCLLIVNYLKYHSSLLAAIVYLESFFSVENSAWLFAFKSHPYQELFGYVWWASWHYIGFLLLPILLIKFVLKQSIAEYGWQRGDVTKHWLAYALLAAPIVCFAVIVSFGDDFSNHYPFYSAAHLSWFDLIVWELLYIGQFVAVEFFFRGFIVNGLRLQFGALSVAVMCLPYLMLHFPKLWLESSGAILFGFLLGMLALRSKSIWGGVAVHVVIALSMDMLALIQTKGLPEHFFR